MVSSLHSEMEEVGDEFKERRVGVYIKPRPQVLSSAPQHVTSSEHLCRDDCVGCTGGTGLIPCCWHVRTQAEMKIPCDNGGRGGSDSFSNQGPPETGRAKEDNSLGGFGESSPGDTSVPGFISGLGGYLFLVQVLQARGVT